MTVAHMSPLQAAVYALITAAVQDVPVYDHIPAEPPVEFIRLEGFSVSDRSQKNGEIGLHAFEVHFYDRPIGLPTSSRGNKRRQDVLAAAHAALMAGRPLGRPLNHEVLSIDKGGDGTTASGMSRYTITLY